MTLASCPSREELAAFCAGNLEDTALSALGTHIDSCPACQRLIQTVSLEANDTIVSALRGSAPVTPHAAESACRSAIERIAALPENSAISIPVGTPIAIEAPLAQLREYKLLAKLGEGGMGAVYKALHTRLDKTVAIKVLPADRMRDAGAVARFQREMKAVGRVDHPNIVRAMDAGEENGMHYLVMEYVPGSDLSQLAKAIGPLPVADACELVRQAALGLAEANEHGMVHRDIKPSNLILTQPRKKKDQPIVKILDLGLALLSEAFSPDQRGLTSTGQMMGTIDYMAPEQGGDSHQVDIRADIYSLGATLYKLLAGEAPFAGEKYDTPVKKLVALATVEPQPIRQWRPDVPAPLATIIHRMLAKDPAARFATPDDVVEALAPFCQGCDLGALLSPERIAGRKSEVGGPKSEVGTDQSGLSVTAPVAPSSSPSPPLPVSPSSSRTRKPPLLAILASAGGFALVLAGIVMYFTIGDTTLRVEINDPSIELAVKGTEIVFKKADNGKDIHVSPGEKTFVVRRGDFKFETEKLLLKKGKTTTVSVELLPDQVRVVGSDGGLLGQKSLPVPEVANVPQIANYALEFDGKSSLVQIPTLTWDGKPRFTVEAWLKTRQLKGARHIITVDGEARYQLFQVDGLWSAAMTGEGDDQQSHLYFPISPQAKESLVHVAYVVDGSHAAFFQNGIQLGKVKLKSQHFLRKHPARATIGGLSNNSFLFEGTIDEVRISKIPRYEKNFTPKFGDRFQPDENTLALYHCDEGQGDVLTDSSGNNHHGKIVGAKWVRVDGLQLSPSQTLATASGRPVLEFNHGLQHVEVDGFPYDPDGPLTLEAWVNLSGLQTAPIIKLRGMSREFVLFRSSPPAANYGFGTHDPTGSQNFLATVPKRVGFRHICGVWDGKSHALYVDGERVGKYESNNLFPTKPDAQDGYLLIGGENGVPISLDGQIAEVRISKSIRYTGNFTPTAGWQADKETLALYRCDEGQGDVLKDWSGHNRHGKIVGAKWGRIDEAKAPAPIVEPPLPAGFALGFDAESKEPDLSAVKLRAQGPWTVEGWFTPSDPLPGKNQAALIFMVDPCWMSVRDSSQGMKWALGGPVFTPPPTLYSDAKVEHGKAAHVALTREPEGVVFFINGERQGAPLPVALLGGERPLRLCLPGDPSRRDVPYRGEVDEIRVSSIIRYRDNFKPQRRFEPDPDTLALFHCDEGTGDVLIDSSIHKRHGKMVGAKWVTVTMSSAAPAAQSSATPPPRAATPFDAAQAKTHQEAWAKHLGIKVDETNGIGMKLRLIPSGEFQMGSTKGDSNEQPVHRVTITRPFYLGMHEVTQQEYEDVVGSNPSKFPGKRLPVEFVTTEEAAEFCRKLSEKEGKTYRLPTEAEWEFACRAGTMSEWSFGDDAALLSEYAWCKENGEQKTHPVGEKKPNPFGLFDMHGNVFEYCSDYTAAYTADPAIDPAGPQLGRYRGFRGGSWFFQKFDSRSADRQDKEWPARGTHVGFRVLLEITP